MAGPTIGLSLGGGGARGMAHVVVLELLDELGVEVSYMSGSSIGALLGMGYASGMSGAELRRFALATFDDSTAAIGKLWSLRPDKLQDWFKPQSYSLGQIDPMKVLSLFTPVDTLKPNIEDTDIPLSVVATDYYGWTDVVFTEGNLREAVAASIAIPFVFKPVRIGERVLIDGNITNPLPFDKLPPCDCIIAVDVVGGPDKMGQDIPAGFETMLGANQIMMQAITRAKLATTRPPDLLIRPPIDEFGVLDFLKTSTILRVTDTQRDLMKRQIAGCLEKL